MNNRFSLGSTLIGGTVAVLFTSTLSFLKQARYRKLSNAKLDITDSLNQDIGYLNCKLDELKDKRARFNTRNIFKMFSFREQLKNVDSEIKDIELQIREKERRISEIRSSNSMKMLRYVENNVNYVPAAQVTRGLLPSTTRGF